MYSEYIIIIKPVCPLAEASCKGVAFWSLSTLKSALNCNSSCSPSTELTLAAI